VPFRHESLHYTMTDFFARVRHIVDSRRSEEKKARAAHAKTSPIVSHHEETPADSTLSAGQELPNNTTDQTSEEVDAEKKRKKSKGSRTSSEDGSVKSKSSKDKKEKKEKTAVKKVSSKRKVLKKTPSALPPTEVLMDSLASLKTGQISVRGQVWLLRMKANREQMEQRQTTSYSSLKDYPVSEEFTEQIGKDIDRTYPQYDLFQQPDVQRVMYNILRSVAAYRVELGYCQGMGYVAGFLKTLMPEEDTFWLMIKIIDQFNMSEFWAGTLSGLPRSFYVLERLMESEMPKLSAHFNKVELQTSMYATPWMMTLFLYNYSIPFSMRIWDLLLFEGINYVYPIALSILMIHEEQMLKMDFDQLVQFLQFSCKKLDAEPDVEQVLRLSTRIRETIGSSISVYEKEYVTMMSTPVQ